jgi:glycerol-3-phosphate acyltransferase PlsY
VPIVIHGLTFLAAYLLGSIPTGYLVGRARGVDIRTVGSKNMGATNVFRTVGKTLGILVLLADAAKGWLAVVWLAPLMGHAFSPEAIPAGLKVVAGVGAILGHNYTCWLQFKGGKGIATTGGVFLALAPWALLMALAAWIIVFAATRYVSVASLTAAVVLPVATWFTTPDLALKVVVGLVGAMAIWKHRKNIERLRAGTESRIEFGKKKGVTP